MMTDTQKHIETGFGRRSFLLGAGGLALGLVAGGCSKFEFGASGETEGTKFGAFLEIANDGQVTITTPGAEMGQGVSSSLPKIVVEELGADWASVKTRLSDVDAAFNTSRGNQRSANSDAVTSYFEPLRSIGASAREMLIAAAAARWEMDAAKISIENGVISNRDNDQTFGFGDVAEDAAKLPVPKAPKLKDAKDFSLIGKVSQRKDIPDKVFGETVFGIDVELPGMLFAAIKHVPVAGAPLEGYDASSAEGMSGVQGVVPLDNAVAVIAESYWQAQQAVDTVTFDDTQADKVDGDALTASFAEALDDDENALPFPSGGSFREPIESAELAQVNHALEGSGIKIEREYTVPYLAHLAMEPLCATAIVDSGTCEVWAPTQAGNRIPAELAEVTGLPESALTIHRTFMGGGFGRKNERDFIMQAAQIAMAKRGRPIKLIWSRQQDTQNDFYRPALAVRSRVLVQSDGTILAAHSRTAGQILTAKSPFHKEGRAAPAIMGDMFQPSYQMGTARLDMVEVPTPIRTGYWRSVARSSNGFFAESLIDDIARELGLDPFEYRMKLLGDNARAKGVLAVAAENAGWDRPKAANTGRGIAFTFGWNSPSAQVIEVSVQDRQIKIERITCAFDCGIQVDPDNIVAQLEGGIVFGLSAALYGKVNFRDGGAVEETFAEYRVLGMAQAPKIDVHLIENNDGIGGVGEAGVPPVAPALCSAIADASGISIRTLPVESAGFTVK